MKVKKYHIILFISILFTFLLSIDSKGMIVNNNEKTIILALNETAPFTSTFSNFNEDSLKKIKWTSSNKSIFTIDSKYRLKANKLGTATLKAEWKSENRLVQDEYKVIVKNKYLLNVSHDFYKPQIYDLSKTYTRYITYQENYNTHWYYFNMPKDGVIDLSAIPSENLNLEMQLLASNDNIIVSVNKTNVPLDFSVPLHKGKYYIKIKNYSNKGTYKLSNKIMYPSQKNDSYNNESFQKASSLKLNSIQEGHLGYRLSYQNIDKYDWFKLVIPKPCTLNLHLIGDPTLDISYYLYGKNIKNAIIKNSGKDKFLDDEIALLPGTYYLLVAQNEGYGGYTLENKITEITSTDIETNSSFQQAPELPINTEILGILGYTADNDTYDDRDWYKVTTYNYNNEFAIQVTPDPRLKNVSISIYAKNGSTRLERAIGNDEIIYLLKPYDDEASETEVYYVVVSYDGDYGNYKIIRY